jgi:alkylation response protein AidB-like acyl-CoA dehydrogenase
MSVAKNLVAGHILAGSDAASIRTQAVKDPDGSWTLNGEKIWITNGGIADLYTVFARTSSSAGRITAFVVEAAWPGVSHGQHEDKMGIRASSTTTVSFADVKVPAENVLDIEGKGFKVAMAILNSGRTGLGGGAVGGMKALLAMSANQALTRKQFNQPIAEFGLIREKISQMTLDCFAAESVVWMVAHYIDSGSEDYSVEAAISKVFASEALQRSAYEALQIAAGSGFMRDYPYEQITRDCRLTQATGVGRDKIFTPMPQLLRGPAGIYEKYTVELQAKRRMANNIRRAERNEDEEMNHLAGFILNKGSYPWDVVL